MALCDLPVGTTTADIHAYVCDSTKPTKTFAKRKECTQCMNKYFQGLPYISMIWKEMRSFNSRMGYRILRSHSPEEHFITLVIKLLLTVITLGFEDLPALILSLPTFKHEKEGKFAGPTRKLARPTHFLPAEGLGPALNAKTVLKSKTVHTSLNFL